MQTGYWVHFPLKGIHMFSEISFQLQNQLEIFLKHAKYF